MRSSDRTPSPAPLSPGETGLVDGARWQDAPPISVGDRLTAIGLIGLIAAIGTGIVFLGTALVHRHTADSLQPLATTGDTPPTPVRDRVPVIISVAPPPAPAVAPLPAETQPQPAPRALQPETLRSNREFSAVAQPDAIAVNPIPAGSTQPQQQAPTAAAIAARATSPQRPTAPPAAPTRPFPVALIAALLQAPEPTSRSPLAVTPLPVRPAVPPAIAPPPVATSPARRPTPPTAPAPNPEPSPQPAPTPASPTVEPPALAQPPQPSASPPALAPTPVAPVKPLQDRFPLDQLQITGSTRFSQAELLAIARKIITERDPAKPTPEPNSTLSPAELVQASEAITKLYTDRGFINSGAFVPADVLTGATPEIRVVEGSLETINVQVQRPKILWLARPLSPNYVRRRLQRTIQTPLQIDQLADAVRLLEQDPLIRSITTELAPGTTLGKSTLNVKVQQAPPLRLTLSVDNGRAPSVGTFRQQVGLTHANILGLGDRLQLGYNRSAGSRSFDIGFAVPINARNGVLSFAYTNSRGEVIEEPFRELDIQSRSQNYEIAFRQPIKQTANEVFALSLRGTHYRNEGVFLEAFNDGVAIPFPARGTDLEGKTRITALRFGQEWLKRGQRDVFSLQSEFSLGINAIGSTQLEEPPDGRFFSWQGRGFWVHSFAPDTLFALKGQLQFANRPLVPVEQISLGGIDTVRGYRTGVLLADNAWFASAEFYLPVLRVPKWQGVLQVVPFIDAGRGWNRSFDQPDPSRLLSVGLGLQWRMGENLRARLDWGIPLINSTAANGQSLRESLFFSIIYTP